MKTLIIILFEMLISVDAEAIQIGDCNSPFGWSYGPQWYCDAMVNPFLQSVPTTIYYGSGDVDSSGVIDTLDLQLMLTGFQNDMADVDGDSFPSTIEDQQLLQQYLSDEISYLPGHWNLLETKEERDDWLDKTLHVDTTDQIPPSFCCWVSGNYGTQLFFNFFGYHDTSDTNINWRYRNRLTNNRRFNIPVYFMGVDFPVGPGHGMAAILTGDDPLNFDDWNFIEPRNDQTKAKAGDWNLPFNSVLYMFAIKGYNIIGGPDLMTIVAFEIDSVGNTNIIYQVEDLIGEKPPVVPMLELSSTRIFFDNIELDSTQIISLWISNEGIANLIIEDMNIGNSAFRINDTSGTILPWDSTTFYIRFTPTQDTIYLDTLRIISNVGIDEIILFGRGILTNIDIPAINSPIEFLLSQNYPNPFNPTTTLLYELPEAEDVSLTIFDIRGEEVVRLVNGHKQTGMYSVTWDASNVSSGIYFYRLQAGDFIQTRKMVLLK